MSKDLTQQKAMIFRIVHRDNLAEVFDDGCHCRSDKEGQGGYVEIGNQELIQKRTTRIVPIQPGGTLSDYVPFYFTPYTPMLYNIKTGYGVPKKPMQDIVLLVSSLFKLAEQGIPFVFSDRHAYLKTAQFSNDLTDLGWIIWPTLQARDFRRDDSDKFEKYQAEALVHKHLPVSGLLGVGCYNDSVRDSVQAQAAGAGCAVSIKTTSGWYL